MYHYRRRREGVGFFGEIVLQAIISRQGSSLGRRIGQRSGWAGVKGGGGGGGGGGLEGDQGEKKEERSALL